MGTHLSPPSPPTAFHSRPPPARLTRPSKGAEQSRSANDGQNRKMCLNAEQSRMEGSDLRQTKDDSGGREKSCHLDQATRLQREPEQPYCGICQAYVEKCICKEPRPL